MRLFKQLPFCAESRSTYGGNRLTKTGFTLIEILLAIGISAIIIVGITSAFWRGSDAWKRAKGLTRLSGDLDFGMDILQTELRNAIRLPESIEKELEEFGYRESFFISDDKKSMTFFTLKRFKEDKLPHIYKVSYRLKSDNSGDYFILQRASTEGREIRNFDALISNQFAPSDYKDLVTHLTGEELKFHGSLFGGIFKLCEQEVKEENGNKKRIEKIRFIIEEQQEIVFPSKIIYVFPEPY